MPSSSLLSGAGRALTQEVLLRASFVIALSSESAALATVPINDGVQPATASANRERLARAEQRIWGDNLDTLCLPMSRHPPHPDKQGRAAADGNGSGTNKLPPAGHGVSPSHPMVLLYLHTLVLISSIYHLVTPYKAQSPM